MANSPVMSLGEPLPHWTPPPLPPGTPLSGRYVTLVPLAPQSHAKELWEAFGGAENEAGWAYLPYGPFADFGEFQEWLTAMSNRSDTLFYAICLADQNKAVGEAAFQRMDPAMGSMEVGHLHFSPLLARTPAATEAMYLMMRHAFELGYRRYEWKCNSLNKPSWNAALRLGFTFEGIFRQAAVLKGHNRDTAWFSIIDKEWPLVRAALESWLDPANFDAAGNQIKALAQLRQELQQTQPILPAS